MTLALVPSQQTLDSAHRAEKSGAVGSSKRLQQLADLCIGAGIKVAEGIAAGIGELEKSPAAVGIGGPAPKEPARAQGAQQAAHVPGVQFKIPSQLRGGGSGTMGQLVEHSNFRERKRALKQPFLQHTDLAGVEAVEPAHRRRLGIICWGHVAMINNILAIVNDILAGVIYDHVWETVAL